MIGFVMMIGVIINHAILLVAAVRSVEAEGATLEQGIRAGLQQRLRAILASTLTVHWEHCRWRSTRAGSVIYRGLAAVNIGGVVISLVFSGTDTGADAAAARRRRAQTASEPAIASLVPP